MPEIASTPSRRSATFVSMGGGIAGMVITSLGAFIIVPLALHAVGPKLYGAWLASGDVLSWMQSFDLGLPNLMIQRIASAHGQGDTEAAGEQFATGMAILGIVAVVLAATLLTVAPFVPVWLKLEGHDARLLTMCFRVGAMVSCVTLFNNSVVGYSRAVQDTALLNVAAVASTITGLIVTLGLLIAGWGLWSLAIGMAARAAVSLAGSALFLTLSFGRGLRECFRVRRAIAMEMARLSPVTALGGVAYAVMMQSENVLVGVALRPELVPVLALTRKGADVLRSVLDMIAWASYGSFAHLVGSNQRHRALHVHAELFSLHLSIGIAAAATFAAFNPSFVARWVGRGFFGGHWLNVLMGGQLVLASTSFLLNYLYRACGPVVKGSAALIAECLVRVPLMVGLLLAFGLGGIPLAAIITSSIALVVAYRWTTAQLSPFSERVNLLSGRTFALRLTVFLVGAGAGFFIVYASWPFITAAGAVGFAASAALLLLVDPLTVHGFRSSVAAVFARSSVTG